MARYADAGLAAHHQYLAAQEAHEALAPADDEPEKTPAQRGQFETHLERLIAAAGSVA